MLGQASLTAGRLTGEMAEGGGSGTGMMCDCSAANGTSVKIFSYRHTLIYITRGKVPGKRRFKVLHCNISKPKFNKY